MNNFKWLFFIVSLLITMIAYVSDIPDIFWALAFMSAQTTVITMIK